MYVDIRGPPFFFFSFFFAAVSWVATSAFWALLFPVHFLLLHHPYDTSLYLHSSTPFVWHLVLPSRLLLSIFFPLCLLTYLNLFTYLIRTPRVAFFAHSHLATPTRPPGAVPGKSDETSANHRLGAISRCRGHPGSSRNNLLYFAVNSLRAQEKAWAFWWWFLRGATRHPYPRWGLLESRPSDSRLQLDRQLIFRSPAAQRLYLRSAQSSSSPPPAARSPALSCRPFLTEQCFPPSSCARLTVAHSPALHSGPCRRLCTRVGNILPTLTTPGRIPNLDQTWPTSMPIISLTLLFRLPIPFTTTTATATTPRTAQP